MREIHELLEKTFQKLPQMALEKRLAQKVQEAGLSVSATRLSQAAQHILSGSQEPFTFDETANDCTIQITSDDLEYVVKTTERFYNEQAGTVIDKVSDKIAQSLLISLTKKWPAEFEAQRVEVGGFKERLETRWGEGLNKLRMLLTIVREWAQGVHERKHSLSSGRLSHLDDVLLRLHVRACQITKEIIVLLENGYADGAMARWRTLHEITIVAAVILKYGEEIAERYVHYQIVESFSALKAYERNHKALGFKPFSKREGAKISLDYKGTLQRFGKNFGDEYGWAAHHLKVTSKQRITFSRLEEEAGEAIMRSPYKMASYNVHASPKGIYFKLGSLGGSPALLAGASNAGLMDPAQHAAVSLAEMTLFIIGNSSILDDIVTGKVIARLERAIPLALEKAHRKLKRDDERYKKGDIRKR